MIFKLNIFGVHCKKCGKPFDKEEFMSGKFYMKIGFDGYLKLSTGYLDLYHKGCSS